MHKNILICVGITILILGTCIAPIDAIDNEKKSTIPISNGNILYVGGSGPGNYTSIQDAIDNASGGDTVFVYNESSPYYENVNVTKSITLIGEDKNTTVIDGRRKSHVIYVKADWVYIRGFTIRNSSLEVGPGYSGIRNEDYRDYIRIEENILTDNRRGITFIHSDNCIVLNNIIKSNSCHGIYGHGFCDNLTIIGNEINYHDYAGIYIIAISNCNISYNLLSHNMEGINMQWQSHYSLISNNTITNNKYYGFWLVNTNHCTIINNFFKGNGWEGICIYYNKYGNYNKIYNNTIFGWTYDDGNNWWCSEYPFYPFGGNYYNVYNGEDKYRGRNQNITGSDGIGDTPYTIPGGDNEDKYPLMYEWGDFPPVADFSIIREGDFTFIFNASSSYDRDGNIVNYSWDFNDGTNGKGKIIKHTYTENGTYDVTLTVTDDDNKQGIWSQFIRIGNRPPEPPVIEGPVRGKKGVSYNFTFNSVDPDGDDVYYYIKWGDGTSEYWIGPYDSGKGVMKSHTWSKRGTYTIKCMARDPYDAESEWAEFEVTIPRTRASSYHWFLERFPLLEKLLTFLLL